MAQCFDSASEVQVASLVATEVAAVANGAFVALEDSGLQPQSQALAKALRERDRAAAN